MKFKSIKPMAHNFSHSFVSLMNDVDNGFVMDDLKKLARKAKGRRISIQWVPARPYKWFELNKRIRKSIRIYQKWLPQHMQDHGVSPAMLKEMRTDIYLADNRQIRVESYVRDSRGREYVQDVMY
ncbi:MAG: hypothetical protein KZQ58_03500 [gamma proteobacterium symbiont of Bathyaustriella thionipta]|nr:hypothetical protein [gamma proteobacterium symbiont of Bathyaustriella thionipta]